MGVIRFNGVSSASIGLVVERPPDYDVAERRYEVITVPGRNGDILMDDESFANSIRNYEVAIGAEGGNFEKFAMNLSAWLHASPGYCRLEDSYNPDCYMLARYSGPATITNILAQAGRATLPFDRKPQRFLKSGEVATTFVYTGNANTSHLLSNPTQFHSKPLIKIYGNGQCAVDVNGSIVTVADVSGYVYVDCDDEDVYKDAINMNPKTTLSSAFPKLKPQVNLIKMSGAIDKVEVFPRWWTI